MKKQCHNKKLKIKESNAKSNFMIKSLNNDLSKIIKEIDLFQLIYSELSEEDEITKLDKTKELLNESKIILENIGKGNRDILDKLKNKFNNNLI